MPDSGFDPFLHLILQFVRYFISVLTDNNNVSKSDQIVALGVEVRLVVVAALHFKAVTASVKISNYVGNDSTAIGKRYPIFLSISGDLFVAPFFVRIVAASLTI